MLLMKSFVIGIKSIAEKYIWFVWMYMIMCIYICTRALVTNFNRSYNHDVELIKAPLYFKMDKRNFI